MAEYKKILKEWRLDLVGENKAPYENLNESSQLLAKALDKAIGKDIYSLDDIELKYIYEQANINQLHGEMPEDMMSEKLEAQGLNEPQIRYSIKMTKKIGKEAKTILSVLARVVDVREKNITLH
ncbi:hypothetical protein [Hydrogenovibrio marinus]|uniref:Uncharacterized protein n=1 Tax=Hydrogenovibrio marinus TaxID=28885 RepID=A0A066ZWJ0_HYDMR|nr:hypothetical protein [Hydrogenovibrio marinus]KDN94681.1 hypothetical protein EI16_12340 [Hydrogenovibrio marinus]